MTILYRLRALVRWLFRRDEIEHALDSDLEDYIERSAAEKMRTGMSESEARRAARIELGGVEQTKERVRATLSLGPIETFIADAGYALRTLRRQKTFTAVAVLTLALGIGVNVAIFTLFSQVLLRPLPVADPDRLVNLSETGPNFRTLTFGSVSGSSESTFSYPMFRDLERAQEPFVGLAAHRIFDASLSTGEQARRDSGFFVSGNYFSLLGLQPVVGRLLGPQDDQADGQAESVVLSYAYWQAEFGGDPQVLGRTLIVNGTPLTIVGVAPRGFHGTTVGARASVFVPITFRGVDTPFSVPNHDNRLFHWVYLFARLKDGVTQQEAASAINRLYRGILQETEVPLVPGIDAQEREAFRTKSLVLAAGAHGQSAVVGSVSDRLRMLLAVSSVILLLCCANVAGLMLVRGAARSGEMAVRAALGASRRRLASLLLTESLVFALPAAALSLPVALLTLRGIASTVPGIPPAGIDVGLNVAAAFVAIGVALLSALVFGLFPLRGLVRAEPRKTLHAEGARQTSGKGVTRFRTALATVQVGLSMALLAVTFVFAQSLINIAHIDPGLDIDALVTFSISPETSGYSPEATAGLFERLQQELAAIPGVASAASAAVPVLGGVDLHSRAAVDGAEGRVESRTVLNAVSSRYFQTLGISLLAGRDFNDTDVPGSPPVAIVNQRLAERLGIGSDIIGRRIAVFDGEYEIVGVVADAKYDNVTDEIEPQVFWPSRQSTDLRYASFYVRGERPSADLTTAVRETAGRVDPIVPITGLRTMEQQLRENISTERLLAGASTAFAVLATVLAGLGLYGVLAYSVTQRSREFGLRFALGASASCIRGMVFRQVMMVGVNGAVIGAASAVMLGRAVRSLVFGVEAGSPLALCAAAGVLAVVTLGSAYIPARRASRVDPMTALRYE
jgi:predicted permease